VTHARDRAFQMLSEPAHALAALQFLEDRTASNPEDAEALFDCAGAYDRLGREAEAVVLYESVRKLGLERLTTVDQARWHVQMGSTLRLLGRLEESRTVLVQGARAHPDHPALLAFLALTEMAADRPRAAIAALFTALLATDDAGSIERYRRALTAYADEIGAEEA
jgi:cyanophycin synthetase